jgi:integrase
MKATKPKLKSWSDTTITKLQPGPETWRLRDPAKTKGLYLVLYPSGKKSFLFYVQHNKKAIQKTLGEYPDMNVAKARQIAEDEIAKIKRGEHIESQAAKWTVSQALGEYFKKKQIGESAILRYTSEIERLGWNDRVLGSISRKEIMDKAQQLQFTCNKSNLSNYGTRGSLDRLKMLMAFVNMRLNRHELPLDVNAVRLALEDYGHHRAKKTKAFRDEDDWCTAYKMAEAHYKRGNCVVGAHWMIAAQTGLRPWKELAMLKWREVDFESRCLRIHGSRMKISGIEREKAKLPEVFAKNVNDAALDLLWHWKHHDQVERYQYDNRRDYVFPSRCANPKRPYFQSNVDFKKLVEAELGYEIETYSLKKFWITKAVGEDISPQVRLGLTDHSRQNLGDIHIGTYFDEDSPQWENELRKAEHLVGEALRNITCDSFSKLC